MGNALWAGISGLNAASQEMDVIGNNLANVNTIGFKSSTTEFADVLSQTISGGSSGSMQVGRGVAVTDIATNFSSGSFETTTSATDCAIDGDGFFMVNDSNGATYYTRAGSFNLDSDGYLVDTNGYKVQGYSFSNGASSEIGDICLQNVQSSPQVTSNFYVGANLDASTTSGQTFNTSQTVYDSLGGQHTLNLTFTKAQQNGCWGFTASLDGVTASSQSADGVEFNADGTLEDLYNSEPTKTITKVGGTGSVSGTVIDDPNQITTNTSSAVTLTYTAATNSWAVTNNGGLTGLSVSGSSTSAAVDLDGSGEAGLTFNGSWSDGQTLTFQVGNAPTINDLYGDTLSQVTLTRGVDDSHWTIADNGSYPNASVSVSGSNLLLDLNGDGTTDATIPISAGWSQGQQLTFGTYPMTMSPSTVAMTFSPCLMGLLSAATTPSTGRWPILIPTH